MKNMIYYFDNNMNIVDKKKATKFRLIIQDNYGNIVEESFGKISIKE